MDSVQTYDVGYYAGGVLPAPETGVLDHNRRMLIPLWEWDTDYYGYCDTLGPGEARLVELIDEEEPVDLRITPPDVYTLIGQSIVPQHEFAYTAGDTVSLYGTFYNLGTEDAEDVEVTFTDLTTSTILGRDTLDFAGLSWENPRVTDDDTAGLSWITDSDDIGIRLIQIEGERVGSENRQDNSVSVPVLIQPRDYATAVRGDPWDMMESGDSAWQTYDIEAIDGDWLSSAWTDSVGGMFEGALDRTSQSNPIPGSISLAIPENSGRWIDSDTYRMLSFAGVWYTPDYSPGTEMPTFIMWRDSQGEYSDWHNISSVVSSLTNGWNQFHTSGPLDLTTLVDDVPWSDNSIQELWLRFQMGKPDPITSDPQIRLSWVRLEESGD